MSLPTPTERVLPFDGVRALAFMAVFAHHAVHVPLLWMGVDLFFVLSGFLITRNLLALRESSTTPSALAVFYFRRVLRIVPPYAITLVLVAVLTGIPQDAVPWFLLFASNVHDAWFGPIEGALNTLWSIAVEEQFYLVWPFVVLLLPRRWLLPTFVAAILAAPALRAMHTADGLASVYRLTWCRMDLLAAGAALAWLERFAPLTLVKSRRAFVITGVLAVVLFALLATTQRDFRTEKNTLLYNVVGFGCATAFFAAAIGWLRLLRPGLVMRVLTQSVLARIGQISYMAYLVHMLAIEICKPLGLGLVATAVLSLALTLAVAEVSWRAVELPLSRFRGLVGAKSG